MDTSRLQEHHAFAFLDEYGVARASLCVSNWHGARWIDQMSTQPGAEDLLPPLVVEALERYGYARSIFATIPEYPDQPHLMRVLAANGFKSTGIPGIYHRPPPGEEQQA